MLLGRPWQFDVDATYKGCDNVYSFWWRDKKIMLLLMRDKNSNPPQIKTKSTLFAVCENRFLEKMKDTGEVWMLVVKGEKGGQES